MLLLSQGVDANSYKEIQLPLANDVADATQWYYPYMRYAMASSIIIVHPDGTLQPSATLNRGAVAQMLYHFAMYQGGRRTQALLSEEENELVNVLQMFDQKNSAQAQYASARALLAARGANSIKPNTPIVQAAVKTAEAFRLLVQAYDAGVSGKLNDVLTFTKDAWTTAQKAKDISPSLGDLTSRVQEIAKNMADQARSLQAASSK
jgi:hypothetical protein